jgi:hypothetical protein
MISGVRCTTQSESVTSPQNNDKLPSTNMHTTLKQYPRFDLPQTMRGMMLNLEVEMVLMLGMVLMVMKMLLPMARRSRWRRWQRFPTGDNIRLTPTEVEEGFRLCHRLKNMGKIWHRFSSETKASIKIRRRDDARGANGP